ncbi:MAG: hypothetical protein EBX70_11215, partial [Betaproteobacteria bacterium]|nr:hypothetical protein [Betaproteobacteria bacterium]
FTDLNLAGDSIHEPALIALAMIRGRIALSILLIHFHITAFPGLSFVDPNEDIGPSLFGLCDLFGLLHVVAFAHPP